MRPGSRRPGVGLVGTRNSRRKAKKEKRESSLSAGTTPRRPHGLLAAGLLCGLPLILWPSLSSVFVPQSSVFPQSSRPPQRIISVIPAVTEMLFAIGAGPQVVGVSSFDHHPAQVRELPRVGGLIDPHIERILALRPDLVIVYGSQTDLRAQLERARIPLFEYRTGGLADIMTTMRELGARTGHREEAERAASRLERELAEIRARVRDRYRPRTLLVFGRDPGGLRNINVSGATGFLHDMLDAAGGTNVFAEIRREAVQATTEMILAAAPEVILELQYDTDRSAPMVARDIHAWQALAGVPAVRVGRVYILQGDEFVVPGPRVAAATRRLARTLHPRTFQ